MFFHQKKLEINQKKILTYFWGFVYMFVYMRTTAVIDIDLSSFNMFNPHGCQMKECAVMGVVFLSAKI